MKDKSIIILGTDLQYDELSFDSDSKKRSKLLYMYDHIVGKKHLFYSENAHISKEDDLLEYRERFFEEFKGWTKVIYVSNDQSLRVKAKEKGIMTKIGDIFIDEFFHYEG